MLAHQAELANLSDSLNKQTVIKCESKTASQTYLYIRDLPAMSRVRFEKPANRGVPQLDAAISARRQAVLSIRVVAHCSHSVLPAVYPLDWPQRLCLGFWLCRL